MDGGWIGWRETREGERKENYANSLTKRAKPIRDRSTYIILMDFASNFQR